MNEVLSSLEAAGLIVRSPAANHGRVVEVALSEKGHEVLVSCDLAVGQMENAMLGDLDDEGQRVLREMLLNCVHRLGAGLP